MLGIWEVPEDREVSKRHFAFGVELDDLKNSIKWLKGKGIEVKKAFREKEPIEPFDKILYLSEWDELTNDSA
ncbi:hypothetical protein [Chengkuizengella axinellae]|uniref:VOC domain-containing protein n=1 Tax=Chengkuizengella axinellae TaxID=3064388 RepID=A0ABT9IX07_9BACL|nr:hypothetical protein [Chengkuizengella sp. 2205SS18-9]MDP5273858.1 hypothetical protein [Chengkuizengella sp. 2205SS18-9]